MSEKLQLPPELAECWGKLTPQQQSLILSRIKALASGNDIRLQWSSLIVQSTLSTTSPMNN
jgi:hypothetical protein